MGEGIGTAWLDAGSLGAADGARRSDKEVEVIGVGTARLNCLASYCGLISSKRGFTVCNKSTRLVSHCFDSPMFCRYIFDMQIGEQQANISSSKHGTLKRDLAYRAISTAIVRLDLPPLSLVDEAALCAQFGLGRTPVREALQRLMHEGLVTLYPRRGAIVTPISALDAEYLAQARLTWEPAIARRAATVGSDAHWEALERILAATPPTFDCADDVAKGTEVDQRFHGGIAEATGNPYLIEIVDSHLRRRSRLSFLFFRHGIFDPATDQHYRILACLRAGDGDAAAALIERHINLTREKYARVFM
ncbi:MAG: GntR family transcriptional regulator [Thermomicrobiales bacterium]